MENIKMEVVDDEFHENSSQNSTTVVEISSNPMNIEDIDISNGSIGVKQELVDEIGEYLDPKTSVTPGGSMGFDLDHGDGQEIYEREERKKLNQIFQRYKMKTLSKTDRPRSIMKSDHLRYAKHKEKMKSRYAKMSDEEREEYKNRYRIRYHQKMIEFKQKVDNELITSFKNLSSENKEILHQAYNKSHFLSKEEYEDLSERTGIFWMTIRKWFQKMRDREKYGIGEFRKPEDQWISVEMSKKFQAVFEKWPYPPREVIEVLAQETGIHGTKIRTWFRNKRSNKSKNPQKEKKRNYERFSLEEIQYLEDVWRKRPHRGNSGYYAEIGMQIGCTGEKVKGWFDRKKKELRRNMGISPRSYTPQARKDSRTDSISSDNQETSTEMAIKSLISPIKSEFDTSAVSSPLNLLNDDVILPPRVKDEVDSDDDGPSTSKKRDSVRFSNVELRFLEQAYKNRPPRGSHGYYEALAQELGCSAKKVKCWFDRKNKEVGRTLYESVKNSPLVSPFLAERPRNPSFFNESSHVTTNFEENFLESLTNLAETSGVMAPKSEKYLNPSKTLQNFDTIKEKPSKKSDKKRKFEHFSHKDLEFLEDVWRKRPPRANAGYYQEIGDKLGCSGEKIKGWFDRKKKEIRLKGGESSPCTSMPPSTSAILSEARDILKRTASKPKGKVEIREIEDEPTLKSILSIVTGLQKS